MENMTGELIGQAKITGKNHITLPRRVQIELGGIEIGQYILFFKEGNRIYIQKGAIKPL